MNDITFALYTAAIASSGALLIALLWSIAMPRRRLWPPPDGNAGWQFWTVWSLIGILVIATIGVASLDQHTLGPAHWGWRTAGAAPLLAGNGLAWWGVAVLGAGPTTGLRGSLVTRGPYRYSRNPQYVGDILIVIGFVLLANSPLVIAPAVLALLSAVIAPFAEEPWLKAQFGTDYEQYLQQVPRFFGIVRVLGR